MGASGRSLAATALVAALIQIQGPDGQVIWLNQNQVISLRQPRSVAQGHFAPGTRCLVMMTNGIVVSSETCDAIRAKLERN